MNTDGVIIGLLMLLIFIVADIADSLRKMLKEREDGKTQTLE